MEDKLFVYGTLRRGGRRHAVLERLRAWPLGKGTVRARLFDLGQFAGARPAEESGTRVTGGVYELPNPQKDLRILDSIGGFDPRRPGAGLFRREPVEVALAGGKWLYAWVYWANGRRGPRRPISSGDYLAR
jgi:gamma-glutamylcyclotransferase (GGCT)/AIG2-like uncharacterized protein YtfP